MFLYGMQVMGDGLAKVSGGKLEQILENLTSSKCESGTSRHVCDCCDPVIFCDYSYGCRFCKLWHHETYTGSWYHYGCQYRYDDHIMDSVSLTGIERDNFFIQPA